MRILSDAEPLGDPPMAVSLAIGVFDGVHLGHAAVIRQMLADARAGRHAAVVVTFDRHPNAIIAPDRTPPMLYPLWRRIEALEEFGIDAVLVFAFDQDFSRQTGEAFVNRLREGFRRVTSLSVGAGFVFGHRRSGNVEMLRRMGSERGFEVRALPPVAMTGEIISSTRVRELVAEGDLSRASALLGRLYSLAGVVQMGDRLGRQLGFPTANLEVTGLALPPTGVYAATARGTGFARLAAVNIGRRPTVDGGLAPVRVEAHLLGFDGDLYGKRLDLEIHRRLRGEEKFGSREALASQIGRDVAAVRVWAGNKGLL